MECKSCGSVKFKKIQYGLYECEYCGRNICYNEYEQNALQEILKPTILDYDTIRKCFYVIDPTRTLTTVPSIIEL